MILEKELASVTQVMFKQLALAAAPNSDFEGYYEGRKTPQLLGISTPPEFTTLATVLGWPAAVVDSLEERLDFLGWYDENDALGLAQIYRDNALASEASLTHLDALIHGVGFIAIHAGVNSCEPEILISNQSPNSTTGIINPRTRALDYGLIVDGAVSVLLTPTETITLATPQRYGAASTIPAFNVIDRSAHNLGIVPLVAFRNRARANRPWGRSEITRPIRALTDMAARTCLGMEVNREFYSAPQRWVMGANPEDFAAGDGGTVTGWQAVTGRVWAMGKDDDGQTPTVGQFTPASPQPYIEQLRALSQLAAAEGSIPAHYLGFVTDNPASADAIRATEARLVKHAERRQTAFGAAWVQVARVVAAMRGGDASQVLAQWTDAATPTRAATTDAVTKLIAAGALPANSGVTYELLGFSEDQAARLTRDTIANEQNTVIDELKAAGASVDTLAR